MSFFPRFAFLLLLTCGIIFPIAPAAQSRQSPSVPALNEQQIAGKALFLQNCEVCHSPTKPNPKNTVAPGTSIGPLLKGLFRGENSASEGFVREFIMRGTQRMPGFRYGLERKEIDNLIAYLKTL